ncbi:SM-like, degradation of cytoplasmic mRNAs and positively regulates transcription initiation [Balamuthia mandrillaris]
MLEYESELTYLPGTASLVDDVDKRILVVLQDGRNLIGILRSFDQYANLVLEHTTERIFVGDAYGEKYLGLFLVRGENIVVMGVMETEREARSLAPLRKVPLNQIEAAQKAQREQKEAQDELKRRINQDMWNVEM